MALDETDRSRTVFWRMALENGIEETSFEMTSFGERGMWKNGNIIGRETAIEENGFL